MLAGAVFLAASAQGEHRRIGRCACIWFSNADVQKYKNQKRSPSDSLFFKHVHGSADNRHTRIYVLWQHGQWGLNVKLIYMYGMLQPEYLNIKFLYVCFSTYESILHFDFSFRASDWSPEHFNGRHSSTSLSLVCCLFFWGAIADVLTPHSSHSSFFPFFNLDWSRFVWRRWWWQWRRKHSKRESRNAQTKIYIGSPGWSSWDLSGQSSFPKSRHLLQLMPEWSCFHCSSSMP